MKRTVMITGSSGGLGAAAARELARRGWQVGVHGRNAERTRAVAQEIGGTAFVADFDSLDEVRMLADAVLQRFGRLDVLVNNAGGMLGARSLTRDGHESTVQRNLLAPALLTELLVPRLLETRERLTGPVVTPPGADPGIGSGRVVHTASVLNRLGGLRLDDLDWQHRRFGAGWRPYGAAKLAVILYARSLADRTGLESVSVHPGYVRTSFGADSARARWIIALTRSMSIDADAGAAPLVHLVDTPELGVPNGTYFDGLAPHGAEHRSARDSELAAALWAVIADRLGHHALGVPPDVPAL